jgi:hypothetical protein
MSTRRTVAFTTQRLIVVAGLLVFVACAKQERDARPVAGSWAGEIEAVGEHGHSGFAVVALLVEGGTRANATLTGGSAGGSHPWHLHDGGCDANGPVIGNTSAYPTLRPDESGNASATVTLPITLTLDAPYSIHLHQSPEDDTLVGCGELVLNT